MSNEQTSFVAGLSLPQEHNEDAAILLQLARADGYDFCTTSLPHFSSRDTNKKRSIRSDVTSLESRWWSTSIVGEIMDPPSTVVADKSMTDMEVDVSVITTDDTTNTSTSSKEKEHIKRYPGSKLISNLCSSTNSTSQLAETSLEESLSWAGHMNIPAVILPPIPSGTNTEESLKYARVISSIALSHMNHSNVQLWIRTPFTTQAFQAYELFTRRVSSDVAGTIGCMLYFDEQAEPSPSASKNDSTLAAKIKLLHRFIGYNVKAVALHTGMFLVNKRGFPTLGKPYQVLFMELLKRIGRTLRVVIEGGCRHTIPSSPDTNSSSNSTNPNGVSGCLAYLQYLRHLRQKKELVDVLDTEESIMETSYLDHLQSPLQPLGDDLEFSTYEVFEKDPVKYKNYREAVELALLDKIHYTLAKNTEGGLLEVLSEGERQHTYNEGYCYTHRITIFVLGAGRGPLIKQSLAAVQNINNRQVKQKINKLVPKIILKPRVIAIEKNKSAVLYLESLLQKEELLFFDNSGGDKEPVVHIFETDMRDIMNHSSIKQWMNQQESKEGLADIVVSELLGSFGDNELSPECLDGVSTPEGTPSIMKQCTISIPQEYTSYIAPLSSMRLYNEARIQSHTPIDTPGGAAVGMQRALETPYVVRSHSSAQTHGEKECFTFRHPGTGGCNERFACLEFMHDSSFGVGNGCGYGAYDPNLNNLATQQNTTPSKESTNNTNHQSESNTNTPKGGCTIHGFLGTFDATLYKSTQIPNKSIHISIAPSSFSVGMFSWFPLYFPIREPLFLPDDAFLRVAFWRKVDIEKKKGVWYEWSAEVVSRGDGGEVVCVSPIHNSNGRSYFVRL